MSQSFELRKSRAGVGAWLILALFCGIAAVVITINMLDPAYEVSGNREWVSTGVFIFVLSMGSILGMLAIVDNLIWKYTIRGNDIQYRSLFTRKKFTFEDIEKVELFVSGSNEIQTPDMNVWRIFLNEGKNPYTMPANVIGGNLFIRCLKDSNVSGADGL